MLPIGRMTGALASTSNPVRSGDPAASEGTSPPNLDYALGTDPELGEDPSGAAGMINARAETASTKPAFRDPMKFRRCLIPADGFYEWAPRDTSKQPY
jgi:putative SOS response-associated peptidase YedK